jgi:hypothetical protein
MDGTISRREKHIMQYGWKYSIKYTEYRTSVSYSEKIESIKEGNGRKLCLLYK